METLTDQLESLVDKNSLRKVMDRLISASEIRTAQLAAALAAKEDETIVGVRIVTADVAVGDWLLPSRVWDDGEPTDEALPGTSCIDLYPLDLRAHGGYMGQSIVTIAGRVLDDIGYDDHEIIVADARVVAIIG